MTENFMSSRPLCAGILLMVFSFHSSCFLLKKGRKEKRTPDTASVITAQPADTLTARESVVTVTPENLDLVNALLPVIKKGTQFSTFSGKAKMSYEGRGLQHDFAAVFRIKKDEVIWASVSALGGIVQVARLMITPDTLQLINYLDKEVTVMRLTDAVGILPVPADFTTLQNLIIGGVLRSEGNVTSALASSELLSLHLEEADFLQEISFTPKDTTIATLQMRAVQPGGPSGTIRFSNYQSASGRIFSSNRVVQVMSSGEQHRLDMHFNKAEFDVPVDFPFSVPRNYKRK